MIHRAGKLGIAALAAAGLLTVGNATAFASGDTGDGFSPAGAPFMATNSGNVIFSGTINGIRVTVTCTGSSFHGTTPGQPGVWSIALPMPPTLTGCTDSLGGTDSVTVSGTWTITWNDTQTSDTEPNTDQALLGGFLAITSSFFPGCKITWSGQVSGSWHDVTPTTPSKFVFGNAPISLATSGCTGTSWTFTATYLTSPGITDT
jgi:hypothetical protein